MEIHALSTQINNPALSDKLQTYSGIGFVEKLLQNMITLAVIIASLVAFFSLIIGGIRFISAGGDKAQTEAARNQVTNAIIGLVFVFSVYALVGLLGFFFGVDLFFFNLDVLILR